VTAATPRAVAEALARLREAGAALRRRPARETLDALARVLELWRDPASEPRRALEKELPDATGFHPATVREGLARALAPWSGEALRALVEREVGGPDALDGRGPLLAGGFETTALLLAGVLPAPTLLAMLAPLALRSPVLVKPSQHDPVTARLVAGSLAEVDPGLGRCAAVVRFAGGDEACAAALLEADCVVATGSDETVAAVAARVRPPRRLVACGHRLSLAAFGPGALGGGALDDAARRLALDTALWDQLGCLSPLALYGVGDAAASERVGEALARALADAEGRWPRGRIPPEAAALASRERSLAEMRGARVWQGDGARWSVVCAGDARPRPAPLYRFLHVHPVAHAAALVEAIRPHGPHLACVALEGFGRETRALARALGGLGASRICWPGEMQSPPLAWRRDNRGVLEPLARFSDLE